MKLKGGRVCNCVPDGFFLRIIPSVLVAFLYANSKTDFGAVPELRDDISEAGPLPMSLRLLSYFTEGYLWSVWLNALPPSK